MLASMTRQSIPRARSAPASAAGPGGGSEGRASGGVDDQEGRRCAHGRSSQPGFVRHQASHCARVCLWRTPVKRLSSARARSRTPALSSSSSGMRSATASRRRQSFTSARACRRDEEVGVAERRAQRRRVLPRVEPADRVESHVDHEGRLPEQPLRSQRPVEPRPGLVRTEPREGVVGRERRDLARARVPEPAQSLPRAVTRHTTVSEGEGARCGGADRSPRAASRAGSPPLPVPRGSRAARRPALASSGRPTSVGTAR